MLKLTWKQINAPNVGRALMKLNSNPKLDRVTAYRVGRICAVAEKEMIKAAKKEEELKKKFCQLDEKGELVKDEQGQAKFCEPFEEYREKMDKAFTELLESNSVEIKVHKLEFNKLEGLTGSELVALEDIVDGIPEIA